MILDIVLLDFFVETDFNMMLSRSICQESAGAFAIPTGIYGAALGSGHGKHAVIKTTKVHFYTF